MPWMKEARTKRTTDMMKILKRSGLAAMLILLGTVTALAEPQSYSLKVNGLACPFCAFGIEKQLSKIDGVGDLKTDVKAGVVRLTMKDGSLLDKAEAKQAVDRAGFTLRGIEKVRKAPQQGGESQ